MSNPRPARSARPSTVPTPRLAAGAAIGAGLLTLGSLLGRGVTVLDAVWMTALLAAAVTDAMALRGMEDAQVQREIPALASLGEPTQVRITVRHGARGLRLLHIKDAPPDQFTVASRSMRLAVPPATRVSASYPARPQKRGAYFFGDIALRAQTRLGLMAKQWTVAAAQEIRVLPDIVPTREHEILARQNRLTQMGVRASRLRGAGLEFSSLRDWAPDDGLRSVDWKATARRGKLIARDYEFERSQNIILALDLGRTMASRIIPGDGALQDSDEGVTKADLAINACVLLGWVATKSHDQVGLAAFSGRVDTMLPPGKGPAQFKRLMAALTPLEASAEECDYRGVFLTLAQSIRKRSLFIVLTDIVDPVSSESLMASLQHLIPKHLVLVVAISDYELRDMLAQSPNNMDEVYKQAVAVSMLDDRRKTLGTLEAHGILTLDAAPSQLTVAAVNKYLEIKRTGRI